MRAFPFVKHGPIRHIRKDIVHMASAFRKAFPWGVGRDCNQGVQDTKTDLGV
jgi:hypothetical protein